MRRALAHRIDPSRPDRVRAGATLAASARGGALALCVCAALAGCGDDGRPVPSGDGGPDADLPAPGLVDIPWLAAGSPPLAASPARACPEGFRALHTDTGILVCDPWPEAGQAECAGPSAHRPGEGGCARVGSECPAGDFPEALPSDRPVVYAIDGAAAGGDGTLARPYPALMPALLRSPRGALVAVGTGTYTGRVELLEGRGLRGACPERVVLTSVASSESDTVLGVFFPGAVDASDLTVRSAGTMGIYVDGGASLSLRGVHVDGASGYGIYVTAAGTSLDAEDVLSSGVAPFPSGFGGVGLQIVDGATGAVRRSAFRDNVEAHVITASGSSATYERIAALRTTGEGSSGTRGGTGFVVQDRGEATLTASAIDRSEGGAVLAALGSTLVATDVAAADTGPSARGLSGPALEVRVGSMAQVTGLLARRALGVALTTAEDGVLVLDDAWVQDTRPSMVSGDASGLGLQGEGTSRVVLRRVLLERPARTGIVMLPGTTLSAEDLVVRDVRPSGARGLGVGMAFFGTRGELSRAVFEQTRVTSISASAGAQLVLSDVAIRDARTDGAPGFYGRGVEAHLGARVVANRLLVERSHEVAIHGLDPDTAFGLADLVVRDTLGEDCGDLCEGGNIFGYGLAMQGGAVAELEGFVVTRSRLLGLQVGEASAIRASRGEVSESPIGMNVQDASFDVTAALTDVAFREVDRNVDAAFLPVPRAAIDL